MTSKVDRSATRPAVAYDDRWEAPKSRVMGGRSGQAHQSAGMLKRPHGGFK